MTLASAGAFLVQIANPEVNQLVYNNEGLHLRLSHGVPPALKSASSKLELRVRAVVDAVLQLLSRNNLFRAADQAPVAGRLETIETTMNKQRDDAVSIWNAGVDAVRARPLVEGSVRLEDDALVIGQRRWPREEFDRVIVVGAGKAATEMAAGLLDVVGDWLPVVGWINVPEGTERPLDHIEVHVARPAGMNEPTAAGVHGTHEIVRLVGAATDRDLCIALISGGGSALLTAPIDGIRLDEKLAVIRLLSAGGADIVELNTVRKHLSSVKGGGLLAACRAGQLVTLILSDILGDPEDMIASGPTVVDRTTPAEAIAVLQKYDPQRRLADSIYAALAENAAQCLPPVTTDSTNFVIGNNAVAVDEAGMRAEQLGYNHAMQSAQVCEGAAEDVGRQLAGMIIEMLRADKDAHRVDCLITGGEPTVLLASEEIRGKGGRNQQLVLAAYEVLRAANLTDEEWQRFALLSGGTDGEDGPTDAAGAILTGEIHQRAVEQHLDAASHLRRNDAYTFFQQAGGLLITGPTGTNVCDLRVAVVRGEGPISA